MLVSDGFETMGLEFIGFGDCAEFVRGVSFQDPGIAGSCSRVVSGMTSIGIRLDGLRLAIPALGSKFVGRFALRPYPSVLKGVLSGTNEERVVFFFGAVGAIGKSASCIMGMGLGSCCSGGAFDVDVASLAVGKDRQT